MKTLLFIIPNSRWFSAAGWELYPYNVCLLAAILRRHYHVKILDCNADNLQMEKALVKIADLNPDFIGISCLAVEYSIHAHALAKGIKKCLPCTPIILGGVYCTLMPEHAMKNPDIDYCVLGEGEQVLGELLKCLGDAVLPDSMDGVAYRINGELIIKPQRSFIQDLDALPFPALDLIDFKKYCYSDEKFSFTDTRDATPVAKIYTSRGCPAGCNFCAVEHIAGHKFRCRSVDNVLDEIQYLISEYGVREIVFYDDNLIFDRQRAKQLFRGMIERGFNIQFKPANIAVYRLDKELLDLMKAAGCTTLIFAVESGCNRVLREIMGKPLSVENVPEIVSYALQLGFRCAALFVIGNPGESWDEIRQTMRFAESLEIYCHFSIATPLPKTRLYYESLGRNYLVNDFSFESGAGCSRGWLLTDQFAPFDLEMLRVYEWDRINFSSPEKRQRSAEFFKVSPEEVEQFARNARVAVQKRYVVDQNKRLA
ncbi:MAG: B12-binding domain-containing radical SAM protein [Geobacteraceae bacterium]|nr:B12-binding domain-containing radical SAM protein [Geobacteraceae bacterium]